eukprot:SAG22_NODE_401_length_11080_cov_18.258082_8_plen_173_part_00
MTTRDTRTITGLSPVQDVICDRLEVRAEPQPLDFAPQICKPYLKKYAWRRQRGLGGSADGGARCMVPKVGDSDARAVSRARSGCSAFLSPSPACRRCQRDRRLAAPSLPPACLPPVPTAAASCGWATRPRPWRGCRNSCSQLSQGQSTNCCRPRSRRRPSGWTSAMAPADPS